MFKKWLMIVEASQQEIYALSLLGKDQNKLNQLKAISPHSKYLPVLAIFSQQQPNLNQLKKDFEDYVSVANKMPVLTVSKNQILMGGTPINYLQWTEKVHALQGEKNLTKNRMASNGFDEPPIFKSQDLEIYEAHGPHKCIKYGKGYSFCISQPGNTMWQSYRDSQGSTFYFVFDKSRNVSDPLHIVVVDITSDGPSLTDASNNTGTIAEFGDDANAYLNYLYKRGVPQDLFKNIAKSPEEEAESKKLGDENYDLNWFKSLSPDEKSKYIGRGHHLSDEQFNFIFDNKLNSLIKQYVSTGRKLSDYQIEKVLKSSYRSSYLHSRAIAAQQSHDLTRLEFDSLSDEQKQGMSLELKLKYAKTVEEAQGLVDAGAKISLHTMYSVVEMGNLELFKFLLQNRSLDDYTINVAAGIAAEHGHEDILNFLIDSYDIDLNQAAASATKSDASSLYLIKKLVNLGASNYDYLLRLSAGEGDLETVKYLLSIETKDYLAAYNAAIIYGHIPVIKLIADTSMERAVDKDKYAQKLSMGIVYAADSSKINVIDFLVDYFLELGYENTVKVAMELALQNAVMHKDVSVINAILHHPKASPSIDMIKKVFDRAKGYSYASIANILKQAIDEREVAHAV